MTYWLVSLLDRVFAVCGALICVQAPMYIQQYGHQLSGRVAELKLQVKGMLNAAAEGSKTLPQYINRFLESGDSDFMRQGKLMLSSAERYDELSGALSSLNQSSVVSRPFIFLRDLNWDIATTTFSDFQPGISFTVEGIAYGLVGVCLGYGLFYLLSKVVRGFCGLFKRSNKTINYT
ncbi:MAG: DUF2937 family protein [Parachlamydiaceae bacterium]|nr:DUF2937 family protein [Parachlamydiaceae bacterium]